MNYLKTVNVTNVRNVLVQIPAFVTRHWGLEVGDKLEVHYDDQTQKIYIVPVRPDVQR